MKFEKTYFGKVTRACMSSSVALVVSEVKNERKDPRNQEVSVSVKQIITFFLWLFSGVKCVVVYKYVHRLYMRC